jgi:tetratricopeptide (TPR) repeat protein
MPDSVGYLRTLAEAEDKTAAQWPAAAGKWPAAAALWARVVELNPVVGYYWVRLAEACYELDDFVGAIAAYEQAEQAGVWSRAALNVEDLHPEAIETVFPAEVAYRIATCRLRSGDTDGAISDLRRAIGLGLRDLDRPRSDEHWEPVRADPAVRELLGIVDIDGMTRDEGWRADVTFFAREVKRRAYAPFATVSEEDFDAAVARIVEDVPRLSEFQILAGLLRLLRPLGDGHAFAIPDQSKPGLGLPVKFYRFAEGLFVTAATHAYREVVGAQVLSIDGRPVDEVLAAVEPLISRDNEQQVRWIGPEVLRWTPLLHALGLTSEPDQATLTLRLGAESGKVVAVKAVEVGPHDYPLVAPPPSPTRPRPTGWICLPDIVDAPMPLYLRNCDLPYWFEYLPDSEVVYFQFNGVGDQPRESLADFGARLFTFIDSHRVMKLIIDLRWNGGGNTYLVQPLLHRLIGCTKINQPGCLYVIIGRGTFSAAQNTATAIERETNAIFVGEPTGSRPNFIGETIPFQLPYSKTLVNVADLYWQTSWPMDHRPWIAPELYAPPTFESYRQNQDPALDAILSSREHLAGW